MHFFDFVPESIDLNVLFIIGEIARTAGQGLGVYSRNGRLEGLNQSLADLLEWPADPDDGTIPHGNPAYDLDPIVLAEALEKGRWSGGLKLHSASGRPLPVTANIFPAPNNLDPPFYFIALFSSPTETRDAELKIRGNKDSTLDRDRTGSLRHA